MDRDRIGTGDAGREEILLPSRGQALDACLGGLGEGLVLLTGEAGVGKTWLGRRLAGRFAADWLAVDVFPGMAVEDLYAALGHALGGLVERSPTALGAVLAERSADGKPVALALDEAHLASTELLEAIRVLSNRLGQADGFAAMVLLGQTPLRLRVDSRPMRPLASRCAARAHLLPLDVDEAARLLGRPDRDRPREQMEALHREAGGNPRRLLQLSARTHTTLFAASPPAKAIAEPPAEMPVRSAPRPIVVGPAKPPLVMEDGLIEVGYDPVDDGDEVAAVGPRPPSTAQGADEKAIIDHYAALQAWDEWARNQGRASHDPSPPPESQLGSEEAEDPAEDDAEIVPTSRSWAEDGQVFAPYSQLFSRARPLTEAE